MDYINYQDQKMLSNYMEIFQNAHVLNVIKVLLGLN